MPVNIFDRLAAVLTGKRPPAADALDRLLVEARQHAKTCETDLAALEASRPETVISGEPARLKLRGKIAEATADLEDARAAVLEVERRLAERQAAEAEQGRRAAYDAATALREAAGKKLMTEYETAARTIAALIADVARADAACERANANLPAGAEPLDTTERVTRMGGGAPGRELSAREVDMWAYPGSSQPLPAEAQEQVKIEPQTGRGYLRSPGIGPVSYVVRRRFRRVERVEGSAGVMPAALSTISLPPLLGTSPPFWEAPRFTATPDTIVAMAGRLAEQQREKAAGPIRQKIIRFEPMLDQEPVTEEAIGAEAAE